MPNATPDMTMTSQADITEAVSNTFHETMTQFSSVVLPVRAACDASLLLSTQFAYSYSLLELCMKVRKTPASLGHIVERKAEGRQAAQYKHVKLD
jgi:hypothetical protein